MIDQMKMEEIVLQKEGFAPLTLRKVTLVDETYFYEMLAYQKGLHKRWEKIKFTHSEVEDQIFKYRKK